MKFSVLIPVYNTEKYLDECMESVLGQTYTDFEVILVDDGSTDSSPAICDGYAELYPGKVRVIHQDNQGQLVSRINAAKAADGDYCVYADADDLLVATALETLAKRAEAMGNPDLLVYSFSYEENGARRRAVRLFEDGAVYTGSRISEVYKAFFTGTGLNNVWTKAVRTDILRGIGFDFGRYGGLRCSEDRLYSMVIADGCGSVGYIYEPLYVYRLFGGSITRGYDLTSIDRFNVSKLYPAEKSFLLKWGLDLPEWQQRLDAGWIGSAFSTLGRYYDNVARKDRKKVLRYDWTAFLSDDTRAGVPSNPFVNDMQKELWGYIEAGNYSALGRYYRTKRLKKKIKRILGKG